MNANYFQCTCGFKTISADEMDDHENGCSMGDYYE